MFLYVLGTLGVVFLVNLTTAILLKYISINFQYNLFNIHFQSVDGSRWTFEKTIVLFSLGYVLLFLSGVALLFVKIRSWKMNLISTWYSCLTVNLLPLSIISGMIFFEGFGMAWQWLFPGMFIRTLAATLMILLLVVSRSFWITRFLRTSHSRMLISSKQARRKFILTVMVLPYITGTLILALFIIPSHAMPWAVYSLGLALVMLPIIPFTFPKRSVKIFRNEEKAVLSSNLSLVLYPFALVLIWIASRFTFQF